MKIHINKFKQLDAIKVELENITLLIGGNNAGKSSIIQAIQFSVSIAQATSLLKNAYWRNDKLSTSIGRDDLVYLPIKEVFYLAQNGKLQEGKDNGINITYIDNSDQTKISISKGRNKNIAIHIDGETIGKKIQLIENPFSILVTGLAGIPNEEKYQTPFVVKKSAARGDSNSVFRNILLLLKEDPKAWQEFQDEIKKIFPSYEVSVDFNKDKDEFINCTVKKDNGELYPIDSCGTGILQVVQIISYIFLFKPKILLLDEPDSHLHPNNQRVLAQRLLELSRNTGTRIVIATHSKYLINELIEDSKLLWLSDGKVQPCENNQIIQSLVEIGALDAGQRLSPPKWILLTEDSNLDFLETLIIANGARLEDGEIRSYRGCTKVDTAQALLEHLRESFPDARFIIHRDRDFLDDEKIEEYKKKFPDVHFLIPNNNDIENYFISKEHLSHCLKISEEEAASIIESAFSNKKYDLAEKYANVKKQNYDFKDQSNKAAGLTTEAMKEFDKGYNPRFIHGKEMLKAIRMELSKPNRKIKDCINSESPYLKITDISNLFNFD